MRAYIQQIDITTNSKVVVTGQLSRTNLEVRLNEHIYVKEPKDGIWGYTLEVIPTSVFGADIMIPFVIQAPWTGNEGANGVRITQPTLQPDQTDYETIQLKVKKVDNFTKEQSNFIIIKGGSFDKSTNQIIIDINYEGGCFPHLFSLEWNGISLESFPPQYNFILVDLSEYDSCKAILPAQLRFDIDTPNIQLDRPSTINLGTVNSNRQIKIDIN
ncbi:hypothetical protein C7447_102556 [Tenacibaculum adriaticum]|uniref:Uncharacterized protein n=1 Tax=Tenacibaculum adriaticum TaxID=413713 RepID=A0A5S5DU89_9FLAO|nr:hypothetical protein [Tenacibaculum adriaticum]TYP99234.1 hypothetical protein C7447_102556 [Tenacibaculum adriaticum]